MFEKLKQKRHIKILVSSWGGKMNNLSTAEKIIVSTLILVDTTREHSVAFKNNYVCADAVNSVLAYISFMMKKIGGFDDDIKELYAKSIVAIKRTYFINDKDATDMQKNRFAIFERVLKEHYSRDALFEEACLVLAWDLHNNKYAKYSRNSPVAILDFILQNSLEIDYREYLDLVIPVVTGILCMSIHDAVSCLQTAEFFKSFGDLENAAAFYKEASRLDSVTATIKYAEMQLYGLGGVPINKAEAIKCFKKYSDSGNTKAMFLLGEYLQSIGEHEQALHLYLQSMLWGYSPSKSKLDTLRIQHYDLYKKALEDKYSLLITIIDKSNSKLEINKAFNALVKLVEDTSFDNTDALILAGDYCKNAQKYGIAAKLFKKAADLGCAPGARNYADMLMIGRGVAQNIAEAIKYYKIAADAGIPEAMFVLGEHYRNSGNAEGALQFYKKSLENGFEPAKDRISQMTNGSNTRDTILMPPLEFYTLALEQLHEFAEKYGYACKGTMLIPELITLGPDIVTAQLSDQFFKDEYKNNPYMYHYVVMSFCIFSGMTIAEKWLNDFDGLTKDYIETAVLDADIDSVVHIVEEYLFETQKKFLNFCETLYDEKWLYLNKIYTNANDTKEYVFNHMLACYCLGISMVLGTEKAYAEIQGTATPIDATAEEPLQPICLDSLFDIGDEHIGKYVQIKGLYFWPHIKENEYQCYIEEFAGRGTKTVFVELKTPLPEFVVYNRTVICNPIILRGALHLNKDKKIHSEYVLKDATQLRCWLDDNGNITCKKKTRGNKCYNVCPIFAKEKGEEQLKLMNYDDAISILRTALETTPQYFDLWYGLGNAYLHKQNYEDACCTFSKAHALNSEDDNCIYNLIVSLAKSGRIDDAELLFQNSKKRYQEDSAEVLRCIIDDCKSKAADFKRLSDNECIELYRKNPEDFWNYVIEEKKRTVNKLLLEDGDFYLRRCNHLKNNLVHLIGTTGENLISIRNALVRDNGDEAYSMCIFDILDTYDSKYIKY